MDEVKRHQDPYGRINGDPPPGMTWTLVEHPTGDRRWLRHEHRESTQMCAVEGPKLETPEEKKARLLEEGVEALSKWSRLGSLVQLPIQVRSAVEKILESEKL